MALTTGRYQTCPTALTPSGYLLIAFLNHTEQAIATGLQTADKARQGLVWAGGGGSARVWLAQLCFVSTPAVPSYLSAHLGPQASWGYCAQGREGGRVRRPRGDSPITAIKGGG